MILYLTFTHILTYLSFFLYSFVGCKLLFKHDLAKRHGGQCRVCAYCQNMTHKTIQNFFGGKLEEFCTEECMSLYTVLFYEVRDGIYFSFLKLYLFISWREPHNHLFLVGVKISNLNNFFKKATIFAFLFKIYTVEFFILAAFLIVASFCILHEFVVRWPSVTAVRTRAHLRKASSGTEQQNTSVTCPVCCTSVQSAFPLISQQATVRHHVALYVKLV